MKYERTAIGSHSGVQINWNGTRARSSALPYILAWFACTKYLEYVVDLRITVPLICVIEESECSECVHTQNMDCLCLTHVRVYFVFAVIFIFYYSDVVADAGAAADSLHVSCKFRMVFFVNFQSNANISNENTCLKLLVLMFY